MPPILLPPARPRPVVDLPVAHLWRLHTGGVVAYADPDRTMLLKRWPVWSTMLPANSQRYVTIERATMKVRWYNF